MKNFLLSLTILLASSLTANALYITKNGVRYQTMNDDTAVRVTKPKSGNTYVGDIVIPATIVSTSLGELPVIEVGSSAFEYCDMLTSVTLPESVKTIADYAFDSCEKLEKVVMPGVTKIGNWSFRWCTSLENLVFPEGLESIGNYCFDHNSKMEVVDLPSTVTNLGGFVFEGNPQIRAVICRTVNPPAIKKGYIDGEEIYTIFEDTNYGDIELIVPDGTVESYRTTLGWHYFTNITTLTTTGIENVAVAEEVEEGEAMYYDILGRVVTTPQKGNLYIKKTANKVVKVVF